MRILPFLTLLLLSPVASGDPLNDLQQRAENNCQTVMDLFIVLDSSGSIGPSSFEQAKTALIDLVSKLQIAPKKVQVWVLNYGSVVEIPISFHNMPLSEYTKENLISRIKTIRYMNGACTATGDALFEARQICDRRCRGFEEGVSRIVLVLTDGNSNCGSSVSYQSAQLAQATRASVFAVGIGVAINNAELLSIATEKQYIVHVNNYLQLVNSMNNITVQTCGIPAFVLPNVKVQSEVEIDTARYYQLNTQVLLPQSQNGAGGFIEIISHINSGSVDVYTSTTNSNPGPKTEKRVSFQTRGSDQYYIEFIDQSTSRLYFSFHGLQQKNEYDFIVKWIDLNAGTIG